MPATTQYGLPYPSLDDAPNGPAQLQALAQQVETALGQVAAAAKPPSNLKHWSSINGPMSFSQTSFAAAANWSGLGGAFAADSTHVYRIRCVVPQIYGGVSGNNTSIQLVQAGAALGSIFPNVFLTGVMRQLGPAVEYVGGLPSTSTVYGVRAWNSSATSAVAAEAGQTITYTIEDLGARS